MCISTCLTDVYIYIYNRMAMAQPPPVCTIGIIPNIFRCCPRHGSIGPTPDIGHVIRQNWMTVLMVVRGLT